MIVNGEFIRNRRIRLGLSQRMVADDICHQSLVSRLENTNHITSMTILLRICDRLQISISDVTKGSHSELRPLQTAREALNCQQWHKVGQILSNQKLQNSLLPHSLAEFHLLYAKMYIGQENYMAAIRSLQLAIKSTGANKLILLVEMYAEMAYVWLVMGDQNNAQEMLTETLRKRARLTKYQIEAGREIIVLVHYRIAQIYYAFENFLHANEELEKAIEQIISNESYHLLVEIQILKAHCAKYLHKTEGKQKALMLAYAAAEFSKDAGLKEMVKPYFTY